MRHMDVRARILGEHDVARDGNILRHNRTPLDTEHRAPVPLIHRAVFDEGGIFLVIDDRLVKRDEIVVRTEQHLCRRVEMPVVGERHRARLDHIAELRKLLALLILRHRTDDLDVDDGDILCTLLEARDKRRIVHYRPRIRHRRNRRIAACSARA